MAPGPVRTVGGHLGTYKGFELSVETQVVARARIWKGTARKFYSEKDGVAVALETTGLSLQGAVKHLHRIVDEWRAVNGGTWDPDE